MSERQDRSLDSQPADLVRFLFTTPRWQRSLAAIVGLSFLAGVAVFQVGSWPEDGATGLILFAAPSLLAGAVTGRVANRMGGRMTLNRSFFLALLAVTVMWVMSGAGALFRLVDFDLSFFGLALALGAILALRLIVLMAMSDRRIRVSLVPASVQSLAALALLPFFVQPVVLLQTGGSLVAFAVAAWLLAIYLDAPMQRSFGVSGFEMLRAYLVYRHEGRAGELEALLYRIGETVSVPVTVLPFRRQGGDIKSVFLTTFLHPGPVGEIGGGNLPYRLAASLEDRFGGLAMPFHGATTHDFNMVSHSETEKAVEAAERAIGEVEFGRDVGHAVRVEGDSAKVMAQRFGDAALMVSTNSPEPTEDLDFSIGYAAVAEAKSTGLRDAMFVDSHNSHGEVPSTYLGSSHSYDIIRTCYEATMEASQVESGQVLLGVASADVDSVDVAGLGIRVAVLDVAGQGIAYVFIDGNNMVPGLRERILDALPVDRGEVMTTDNHVVNMNGNNPVGTGVEPDDLVEDVKGLVDDAFRDMESVEFGMGTEIAKDVKVFGSHRTAQIATTFNAILATGKGMIVAYLALAILFTLMAFFAI